MKKRLFFAAGALSAAAVVLTGCATASPEAQPSAAPTPAPTQVEEPMEVQAAWLDEGRAIAIITMGSSSCPPIAEEATAAGQTITVTMENPAGNTPCTADFAPRASLVGVPAGVDPTQDVKVVVELQGNSGEVSLSGLAGATAEPGTPTDYQPSAGWFSQDGAVLLTWGSSSCAPIVSDIVSTEAGADVALTVLDGPCTMDMAPRVNLLHIGGPVSQENFVLNLSGPVDLDGKHVTVIGG